MWLAMRAAAALDAGETALFRILAPIAKYWICKRAPAVAAEALECHGGNGFIEEHVAARLYRDAPVNGLWEGSGNVICLDVVRALTREPEAVAALQAEIALASGGHKALNEYLAAPMPTPSEGNARHLTQRLAVALTASLLLRFAPQPLAEAFCATRLGQGNGFAFGTLPAGVAADAILQRAAMPVPG